MREPIYKSVAMPPKFMWAPFLPAVANMGVQMPIMTICLAFGVNPIYFLISIVAGHIGVMILGATEPHLSAMMKSKGPFSYPSVSIYKRKGYKLAP